MTPIAGISQTLTPEERTRARNELDASRKAFLDSIAGLTDAQWNYQPAPDVWSIGDCAEHIALSEDVLFQIIEKLAHSPSISTKGARQQDELVLRMVRDRSQKLKAPETIMPTHGLGNRTALVQRFLASRRRTMEFVRDTEDELRRRFAPHPVYGTLDAYQWILLLSAHTERHTAQLNEIKASPGYPKH